MKYNHNIQFLIVLILSIGTVVYAEIITVPGDFEFIQEAIDEAENGDSVLVASGTYTETINFNGKAISLLGNPGDPSEVIIDGDNNGCVVTFDNDEQSTSVLNGFTVRNGNGENGGGILCEDAAPILANLRIIENHSSYNGGGLSLIRSSPQVHDVIIYANSCDGGGGGIFMEDSDPSLSNVSVIGNYADTWTGGVQIQDSYPDFDEDDRCSIYLNSGFYAHDFVSHNEIHIPLDTFTVAVPTYYHAYNMLYIDFDIRHGYYEQIEDDIYVDAVDGDDSNSGTSADDALQHINSALTRANGNPDRNCIVHIADGTYSPSAAERYPFKMFSYLTLEGESRDRTIFDADSSIKIFLVSGAVGLDIKNLTLTGGYGAAPRIYGGALNSGGSEFTIENVLVKDNIAQSGGGGMSFANCEVFLRDVVFENNKVVEGFGNGISSFSSRINLEGCVFRDNGFEVSSLGGAIYGSGISHLTLKNTLIHSNAATNGGAIYGTGPFGRVDLINVTIVANETERLDSLIGINNGGVAAFGKGMDVYLVNSILYDNEPNALTSTVVEDDDPDTYSSRFYVSHSDIQNSIDSVYTLAIDSLFWHDGNIDSDPLFSSVDENNYTLSEVSPCIDAGTAFQVWNEDTLLNLHENQFVGNAPDMGAFEFGMEYVLPNLIPHPSSFTLSAFPNPFNASTLLTYSVPIADEVTLKLFDITGREVEVLQSKYHQTGSFGYILDSGDLAAGIYIIELRSLQNRAVQKLALVK